MLCGGGGGGVEKLLRARMGAPVSGTRETHRLGKLRDSMLKNQEGTITAASESFFSRTSNVHFEPSLGRRVFVFLRHVSRVLVSACVCRFFSKCQRNAKISGHVGPHRSGSRAEEHVTWPRRVEPQDAHGT